MTMRYAARAWRACLAVGVLLPALLPVSPPASAASEADGALSETVVTATRTPQPLSLTGSSVSVVSGAALLNQQITAVSDALGELPGLSVLRTGGPGQATSLYLRGAPPGETLVLIDGMRINDPSTPDGQAVLGDLFVTDVDRIEVLRGPQSTLYGSDAMGGVVDIITRRGSERPFSARAIAEGGSFSTWHLNASANGTVGALEYGSGLQWFDTRGITVAAASAPGIAPDGDRDLGANLNLRWHAGAHLSVDLRGVLNRSRVGIPGYPPPDYTLQATPEFLRDVLEAGYAGVNGSWLDGHLQQRLAVIGSDSNRRYYGQYDPSSGAFSPAENSYYRGGATRWEYQGVLQPNGANELSFGAETQLITLLTDTLPDPLALPVRGHDRLTSFYGQWQSTLARALTLTGGVRQDHDDAFGAHDSLKLAAAWRLPEATVLRADYGSGFKAPTLYQQFSPYANPLGPLRPQVASGWEVGVDHGLAARLRVSLTWFSRREHDLIEFDDCTSADPGCLTRPFGYYYNVGRAKASGLEAELAARPASTVNAWLSYTRLVARDEVTGLPLPRVPRTSLTLGIVWATPEGRSAGVTYGYTGARPDEASGPVTLPSAAITNVFASYPLLGAVQVQARIENLFNQTPPPAIGYRRPGRALYAGLRAEF